MKFIFKKYEYPMNKWEESGPIQRVGVLVLLGAMIASGFVVYFH